MPIFKTFSKRLKECERQDQLDVYQYDHLPVTFRRQVIHIWADALGPFVERPAYSVRREPASNRFWRQIHDILARENGVFSLGDEYNNPFVQCQQHLLGADTNGALDIIELTSRWVDTAVRKMPETPRRRTNIEQDPDEAIRELNHRFQEHGIGYQYAGGELIRVDSQYLHTAAVKPAISLLQDAGFRGASDEFLHAHEHYRKGRHKEAVAEALKAFESTMKAICDKRGWTYNKGTAKELIDTLFENDLIPEYLASHLGGLRSAMESGLPTVRNKTKGSGHGQGMDPVAIPNHFAAYALHLAASNIVFLVEAHKSQRSP